MASAAARSGRSPAADTSTRAVRKLISLTRPGHARANPLCSYLRPHVLSLICVLGPRRRASIDKWTPASEKKVRRRAPSTPTSTLVTNSSASAACAAAAHCRPRSAGPRMQPKGQATEDGNPRHRRRVEAMNDHAQYVRPVHCPAIACRTTLRPGPSRRHTRSVRHAPVHTAPTGQANGEARVHASVGPRGPSGLQEGSGRDSAGDRRGAGEKGPREQTYQRRAQRTAQNACIRQKVGMQQNEGLSRSNTDARCRAATQNTGTRRCRVHYDMPRERRNADMKNECIRKEHQFGPEEVEHFRPSRLRRA